MPDAMAMNACDRKLKFANAVSACLPEKVCEWLESNGFFTQAASTAYHGAYSGGLFDHSFCVMEHLLSLTESLGLQWQRPESPVIIGMFHDLCKIDQYKMLGDGKFVFVPTPIAGHGSKSVLLLSRLIDITEEELACIRYHMGAFGDKAEQRGYSDAVERFPNVLWTHTADMIAAHIDGT